ncbi:MAG: hypothetical protein AB9842_08230 [Bacteroidales bacterium]
MDIDQIDINPIQALINKGEIHNLTQQQSRYLEMMETARGMYMKYKSQNFIINTLMRTRGVTRVVAGRIFCDALNFFYMDNDVSKDAWRNIYAEKLEHAAALAWEKNEIENYRRCIVSAAEMRGLNKEDAPKLPPEIFDRRPVIYINDPVKIGIPRISKSELLKFIEELDITDMDRRKIMMDANITDVEFEEDDQS